MNEARKQLVAGLKSRLVVNCQAYPGEPMHRADITAAVARSVTAGGVSAVGVQGLADIIAVRQAVEVPIIGLIKAGHDGVYITPSVAHAEACIETGADIVAVDATLRERGAGEIFADAIAAIHDCSPQSAVMADCASLEDAKAAEDAGADLIGITLAGYTPDSYVYSRPVTEGPDLRFIEALRLAVKAPVAVEGRIHSLGDLQCVFEFPAHLACVGAAITHPQRVTGWYTKMLPWASSEAVTEYKHHPCGLGITEGSI